MVDYREVVEELYKSRCKKSGNNWISYICDLESRANEERYVELNPYVNILNLKRFLINNKQKMISHKIIRKFIEPSIKQYDEDYIGNIENIIDVIETLIACEYCDGDALLEELKRIFLLETKQQKVCKKCRLFNDKIL